MSDSEKMTVLMVEPEKVPYVKEIESDLSSLQHEVGGYIQAVYPYEDPVALIVNEEGKLNGLALNRALRDDTGEIYDVVAGNMLIVGLGEEDFCSLTQEQIEKYEEQFEIPEQFMRLNGKMVVLPMEIPSHEVKKTYDPVYRFPASYASEHGQLEAYRKSYRLNIACTDAIEQAIAENYAENRLNQAGAEQVVEQFGPERVQYVLAATIQHMTWDDRYSQQNKEWANTIPVHENKDPWGQDRNTGFMISRSHPGLVDLFTNQVRNIEKEQTHSRTSVMDKLQKNQPVTTGPSEKKKQVPER